MMKRTFALSAALALLGLGVTARAAITIDTVTVGNPGNAADTRYATPGYGSVSYTYNIGKYEVTAGQYTEFLNAVAKTDTYGLYSTYMNRDADPIYMGCNIKRTGTSGNYAYSVAADWANRPVNYVSYWDSCRFANWLHNGQPTGSQGAGTTETGAYTLNGYNGLDGREIQRNAGWKWAVTSEDEWYKAAYHKNDGVTGHYFDYPTSSDSVPSNDLANPDPGNNANFYQNGYTIGYPYFRAEVGEFENSDSPYGTFDQGGNVWEWNEAVLYDLCRGMRGGSSEDDSGSLPASFRSYFLPPYEDDSFGFRVSEVPEPTTMAILVLGGIGMLMRRRGWGR